MSETFFTTKYAIGDSVSYKRMIFNTACMEHTLFIEECKIIVINIHQRTLPFAKHEDMLTSDSPQLVTHITYGVKSITTGNTYTVDEKELL